MKLKVSLFDRRQFLRWLSGFGLGGVAVSLGVPISRFLRPDAGQPPAQVDLTDLAAGLPPNSGKFFRYGQWTSLLVRKGDGKLVAFSARCTHADCTVSYDPNRCQFLCACHQGVYDLDGKNVSGPPPRPLTRYFVTDKAGRVVAGLEPRRGPQSQKSAIGGPSSKGKA